MQHENEQGSLEALRDIRKMMEQSARFVSLSGLSGIWAGVTAMVGGVIAFNWLRSPANKYIGSFEGSLSYFDPFTVRLMLLGVAVFAVAFSGAYYFTYRKARKHKQQLWNNASRQLLFHLFFPLLAGGVFCVTFIYYGCSMFIGPACLVFYGLALVSCSRHTLGEIRYLGMLEVALGCVNLFFPGHGLYFWVAGFGVLHVIYGAVMWNRHDQ